MTLWSGSDKDSIIKQVVKYVEMAAEIEAELSAVAGDADKFSAFLQKFRYVCHAFSTLQPPALPSDSLRTNIISLTRLEP